MNSYPPEVTTPPLPLVALLGHQEWHSTCRDFLRVHNKPPINTISVSDPAQASRIFGERKASFSALPNANFVKADWFVKHRQRSPAVAVVLLAREWVVGDPTSWTRACEQLDWVRTAARRRGARVAVAIVQTSGPPSEVPEERLIALRRRADLEPKCLVSVSFEEGDSSLARFGRVVAEQASQFYADEIRRVHNKMIERAKVVPQPFFAFSLRSSFKQAAYSEFRQDWSGALKHYQAAYRCAQEMAQSVGRGGGGVQRQAELRAVSEQMHVKILSLMLYQQRPGEALEQIDRHIAAFRPPKGGGLLHPAAAAAAHWGWLSQQYTVAGQLLSERADASLLPDSPGARPAHFFLCAAHAAAEQRAAAGRVAAEGDAPELVPGAFLGQVLARETDGRLRPATDEEYVRHLAPQQAAVDHSEQVIRLLRKAHDGYSRMSHGRGGAEAPRAPRTAGRVAVWMAEEHLRRGEVADAKRLLDSAAVLFRRERWDRPLASILLMLRGASAKLGLGKEHAEHSLELAAMRGALSDEEASAIAHAAAAAIADGSCAGESNEEEDSGEGPVFEVSPSGGLCSALQIAAGFSPQIEGQAPESIAWFCVAFRNNLPVELESVWTEVVLSEGDQTIKVPMVPVCPLHDQGKIGKTGLKPLTWNIFWSSCARPAGTIIRATSVFLHCGRSKLVWDLSAKDVSFNATSDSVSRELSMLLKETSASVQDDSAKIPEFGLYRVQIGAVEASPVVSVTGPSSCLVGERVPLLCTVSTGRAPLSTATLSFELQCNGPDDSKTHEIYAGFDCADIFSVEGGAALKTGDAIAGPLRFPETRVGQTISFAIEIPARQVGVLTVSANLRTSVTHSDRPAKDTSCTTTSAQDVKLEAPFQLTHSLYAPPNTHILCASPKSEAAQSPLGFVCVPCGRTFFLSATLHAAARCQVRLLGVDLVASEEGSIEVAGSCGKIGAHEGSGIVLCKGNAYTTVFNVLSPKRPGPIAAAVRLRWQRAEALSASPPLEGELLQPTEEPPPAGPGPEVVTDLPLPALSAAEPLVAARTEAPAEARVGEPFPYRLHLRNTRDVLQDVAVRVWDSSGFVFAGERSTTVSVPPDGSATVGWTVVAYSAGAAALPDVELACDRHSARLRVASSSQVFVMPRELGPRPQAAVSGTA